MNEIQPLTQKSECPPFWTFFLDGADKTSLSMLRLITFLIFIVFLPVWGYLCLYSGTFVMPPNEFLYFLMVALGVKPIQKFAESKEIESQLNYDFQMNQLSVNKVNNTADKVDKRVVI